MLKKPESPDDFLKALPAGGAFKLAWPIIIENLLYTLAGVLPVLILGRTSDEGVAAVGTSYLIIVFGMMVMTPFAQGTMICMTHALGAKRRTQAEEIGVTGVLLNLLLGALLGVIIFVGRLWFPELLGLEGIAIYQGAMYLKLVGGTLILQGFIFGVSAILKAYGSTRPCMHAAVVSNSFGIILAWVLIEGRLGAPAMGVGGICLAMLTTRLLGCVFLMIALLRSSFPVQRFEHAYSYFLSHVKAVVLYSVPVLMEPLSYQFSQIVIAMLVGKLGMDALVTRTYIWSILSVTMITSIGFGQGAQILVGLYHGAGNREKSLKVVHQYIRYGMICVLLIIGATYLFRHELMNAFVDSDARLLSIGLLLQICLVFDVFRVINIMAISALFAIGQLRYPFLLNIVGVWLLSVPLAYTLGLHLGYGLVGVMLAMTIDEIFRGICNYARFRSRSRQAVWHAPA